MPVAEHRYLSFDATPLFYRRVSPDGPIAASLLVVHGMSEHGGRYLEFARAMAGGGLECWLADLRGFGKSSGQRGDARSMNDHLRDLAGLYRFALRTSAARPLFMLGHSFGGFLTGRLIDSFSDIRPRGIILTSPLVRPALTVPAWKVAVASVASAVWPTYAEKIPIQPAMLTHDRAVLARDAQDPLLNYKITARQYMALRRSLNGFPEVARRLRLPALVLQAGEDCIVSRPDTERFFRDLGSADKEMAVYDGLFHEILNETARPAIYSKILSWVIDRSK